MLLCVSRMCKQLQSGRVTVLQAARRVFQEAASEQHTMTRDSTKRHLPLKKSVVKVSFNRMNV